MAHSEQSAAHHGHHIIPFKTLAGIFGALVVLTVVTVLAAQVDLGPANVPLALAIALSKATLVAMFFMALKYDRPINTLVLSMGIIFVVVFLVFTWFDTGFRGDLGNVDSMTIQERAYQDELLRARDPGTGMAAAADTATAADTTAAANDADTTGAAADTASAQGAAAEAP